MNLFHCAFCVFGYIHVMKRTLLYFLLLVGISACNKPEPKTDELAKENLELLQILATETYLQIAKLNPVIPEDYHNLLIDSAAKNIYNKCDSTDLKLRALNLETNPDEIRVKSQKYFDEFINAVNTTPNTECLKNIEPMKGATSDIDNNRLKLWIFGAKCLLTLQRSMSVFCGIIDQFMLISNTERKKYRLGDTIRIITFFNKDSKPLSPSQYSEKPLKLKYIKIDSEIIKPRKLTSRFDNGYIEFIPTEPGNYSITLMKGISRLKTGKIDTYESSVEFTVLP